MQTNNKLREALQLAKATFETLIKFQGDEGFVRTWAELGRDAMLAALAAPATAEKSSAVGDAAKLRETLEAIISGYENADLCDTNYGEWCHEPANPCVNVSLCKAIHESRVALSAPPRNCDIGSAEEQWRRFCDIEAPTCRAEDVCHCRTAARCFADWSQRPYKEGGAK